VNIYLTGDTKEIKAGLQALLAVRPLRISNRKDISITVQKLPRNAESSLQVSTKNGFFIAYKEKSNFFRALSILLQNIEKTDYKKQETALFEGCSAMIDLSRNAVYTVAEMKRLLSFMALAGHNRCYLYMEDTYELPGYPYFGYLRGRYSLDELKQIDDFAWSLGIEAIPCIQTLAHLKSTLKWGYAQEIKDTEDILLVGEEGTYQLIEAMISTLLSAFRTDKIHIGMDEAMELGTGRYLREHGFANQFGLMIEHLNRVNQIVHRYGGKPMIWDDMFYRPHNKNHDYYNFSQRLTSEQIAQVPPNITLAYWDYYHNTESEYDQLLAMRDLFPNDIIFAGGIWRWMGYVPLYSKTFTATNAALAMCKKHRVKEIMATAWGDNGAEAPIRTILPGLILFGEHCFGQAADEEAIDERCKFLTGLSLSDFQAIERLDLLPGCEYPNLKTRNPSKQAFYQDIFLGAFDQYFAKEESSLHYLTCEKKLSEIAARAGEFADLFQMYACLAAVLAIKSTLGGKLRTAYQSGNREELCRISQSVLPQLNKSLLAFQSSFSKVWFYESKGQGFEVIDIRLGGLISRVNTAEQRLSAYLKDEIPCIEELAETLLPFTQGAYADEAYVCFNLYHGISTQSDLG
jgi:hexosaminidase